MGIGSSASVSATLIPIPITQAGPVDGLHPLGEDAAQFAFAEQDVVGPLQDRLEPGGAAYGLGHRQAGQ